MRFYRIRILLTATTRPRMVKGGTRPYRDLILRVRLGHAGVKVKWEPVEARQLEHSDPSLALGFFVSAPPQRMPAAPRAFYSFVQ